MCPVAKGELWARKSSPFDEQKLTNGFAVAYVGRWGSAVWRLSVAVFGQSQQRAGGTNEPTVGAWHEQRQQHHHDAQHENKG